jgi:hypothetical protein
MTLLFWFLVGGVGLWLSLAGRDKWVWYIIESTLYIISSPSQISRPAYLNA